MIMCQQTSPKANILNSVSHFLKSLPFEIAGKRICVCLSGGADSVALLHSFLLLKDDFEFEVKACHFNHGIRGNDAEKDELFCKKLCEKLGVEIFIGRDDVPAYSKLTKKSIEEAARDCRYAFFSRILKKETVDFCATAHNMNDDAETLLLNLLRGSGVNGASSIEAFNDNYLRPFLKVKRDEIEAFLLEINQDFVTDTTNNQNDYKRNYLRNVVFPLLGEVNPSVVEAFSRFTQSNRDDRDYFEQIVDQNLNSDLRELHQAVRHRLVLRLYKDYSGKILNAYMLNEIDKALFSQARLIVPLFDNDEAVVFNGQIVFSQRNINETVYKEHELDFGENIIFDNNLLVNVSEEIDDAFSQNDLVKTSQSIVSDGIVGKIRVRQRQQGDKITINGVNKSLKKLFIDNKIPKEYRNIMPIFFDDEGIIYVPFIGVADRVYSREDSRNLIITTVFNTIDKERWCLSYEKKK